MEDPRLEVEEVREAEDHMALPPLPGAFTLPPGEVTLEDFGEVTLEMTLEATLALAQLDMAMASPLAAP